MKRNKLVDLAQKANVPMQVLRDIEAKSRQHGGVYMDTSGIIYFGDEMLYPLSLESYQKAFEEYITNAVVQVPGSLHVYNTDQVCRLLDVSRKTLQHYRDNGSIRFSQIGRKIFYTKEHIEEFIRTKEVKYRSPFNTIGYEQK